MLAEADDGGRRFLAATIRSRSGGRDDPLYVHAKVGIVDDRWLTVGSANLNAHSLMNDTEMNVVTDDAGLARDDAGAAVGRAPRARPRRRSPPRDAVARWSTSTGDPIAAEQLERRERGLPPTHRLIALPGVSKRSRAPPRARSRASPTTADARFARSLRAFRGAPAVVPSAPSVWSRAAFGRNHAESPSH